MRIVLIGATGLVGSQLLPLIEERHEVLVVGRRASGAACEKLGAMADWPGLLAGEAIDLFVSTLGTTIRQAGSWRAFAAVDHDAVVASARAARAAGARVAIMVSSVGADAGARGRYLRIKGEAERDVAGLGFERVEVIRPGLLLGQRTGPPRRLEAAAIAVGPWLAPLLRGRLSRYAPIEAAVVARAIVALASAEGAGVRVHENKAIRALASAAYNQDQPLP